MGNEEMVLEILVIRVFLDSSCSRFGLSDHDTNMDVIESLYLNLANNLEGP